MEVKIYECAYSIHALVHNELHKELEKSVLQQLETVGVPYFAYILGEAVGFAPSTSQIKPYFVGYFKVTDKLETLKSELSKFKGDLNISAISFIPRASHRLAYLFVSELFHKYEEQIYNDYHPERPVDIGWKCKEEYNCKYKPSVPIRVITEPRP